MEAKTKDLWVFVETNEDGTAKNVGIELLTPGKMMAGKQGGALVAVVIGNNVDEAVKAASEHGADKVIVVDGPEYAHYTTDAYAIALCALVEKYGPTSMLIGATNNGRDLGPRCAARLHTGLTADCTALDIDEESGNVAWTRPAFGGNLMATILCPDHRPQIGTVRPGVFKKSDAGEAKAEVIKEDIHVDLVEIVKSAKKAVDLIGADVVVSVGRGISADPKRGLEIAEELANVLGGVVGASRAVVDDGYIGVDHQVGQTGKTVHPKIYVALGISGAIQHVSGMQDAECIIAVNKNENAPIFDVATYGITGDLFKVGPMLTEAIAKFKAEKA